jgi:hypothetical protein
MPIIKDQRQYAESDNENNPFIPFRHCDPGPFARRWWLMVYNPALSAVREVSGP